MLIIDQRQSATEGNLWLDDNRFVSHLTTYRKYGHGWMFEPPESVTLLFNVSDRATAIEHFLSSSLMGQEFRLEQTGVFAFSEMRSEMGT